MYSHTQLNVNVCIYVDVIYRLQIDEKRQVTFQYLTCARTMP